MELVNPLYKNINSLYITSLNYCINPSLEVNQINEDYFYGKMKITKEINEALNTLESYLFLQMLEENNWTRLSDNQKEYYSDLAD